MQLFNSSTRLSTRNGTGKKAPEPHELQFLLTDGRSEIMRRGGGSVIAFTAANEGEGVSHVVHFFAEKLATQTGKRTAVVQAPALRDLRVADFMKIPGRFAQTSVANLWLLASKTSDEGGRTPSNKEKPWREDLEWGLDPLQALAANFSYTLIDCPSLGASCEAEMLAPDVDGVVLVVEADRTRRDQIVRAKRTIELANGKLTAMVLNKRRHVVPEWIYRRL